MYIFLILLAGFSGIGGACFELNKAKVSRQVIGFSVMLNLSMGINFAVMCGYLSSGFRAIKCDSTGGALGMILACFVMGRIVPLAKKTIYRSYFLLMPLVYGIGKLACAYKGCCGGSIIHGKRVPVQVIEAISFIILFLISFYLVKKDTFKPGVLVMVCTVLKFLLDFLRDTHVEQIISFNQGACLVTFAILLCIFAIDRKALF